MTGVDVSAAVAPTTTPASRPARRSTPTSSSASIADATLDQAPDVVLALHACDTATDDALARAVEWEAPLVLAAPCCHHDIAAQLRKAPTPAPYAVLTRHGILRERFADTLTDALRASLLRRVGYRVDVVQFVESAHTPRNTMLRACAPVRGRRRLRAASTTTWWPPGACRPRLGRAAGAVTAMGERLLRALGVVAVPRRSCIGLDGRRRDPRRPGRSSASRTPRSSSPAGWSSTATGSSPSTTPATPAGSSRSTPPRARPSASPTGPTSPTTSRRSRRPAPVTVWVGDIGDNRRRATRSRSPACRWATATAPSTRETYDLVYPDGPARRRGAARAPRHRSAVVVTKGVFAGDLYAAPPELADDAPNRAGPVGETHRDRHRRRVLPRRRAPDPADLHAMRSSTPSRR